MRPHVLAFIDDSRACDDVVSVARDLSAAGEARLTLVAVAVIEAERNGCCDLRSGVWNRSQREVAVEQLRRARTLLPAEVDAALAIAEGPSVEESLVRESISGGYDLVVVADERRRLMRWKAPLADRLRARLGCEVTTPGGR